MEKVQDECDKFWIILCVLSHRPCYHVHSFKGQNMFTETKTPKSPEGPQETHDNGDTAAPPSEEQLNCADRY